MDFCVTGSTGTYIRSLAIDFGTAPGVGGYLSSICRTGKGTIFVDHANSIEDERSTMFAYKESDTAAVVWLINIDPAAIP
ncbi:MAG: hypothetical protein MUE99_11810 [Chitinophagaceae bacterium]|jgi:tRNA U55 pseudouridine synthase TruB|nr:hypothetical protein [Chitinophagaceae bacterium]